MGLLSLLGIAPFDLFRPQEIYILADAIEAMTFQIDYGTQDVQRFAFLRFEGRESFRIDLGRRRLLMSALSGIPEEVYHFRRWRPGDVLMWVRVKRALAFYDATVRKVRRQDYRALFGNKMAQLIKDLADLMEAAEAEARALAKIDRTEGGNRYHPEVARMVQRDEDQEST